MTLGAENIEMKDDRQDWDLTSRVINTNKVRGGVEQFQTFQSPENDVIFPAI